MMPSEPNGRAMFPASLSPELEGRFLAAMQAAASEPAEDEWERRLRRLRPASLGARRQVAWLSAMQQASSPRSRFRAYSSRWGAVAALVLFCTVGALVVAVEEASAQDAVGLACRRMMVEPAGTASRHREVQWQEGQKAVLPRDVLYEDSFILDGDEGSTITVRVPVRTQVMEELEVI